MAEDIGRKDVVFDCKVLKIRARALSDNNAAVSGLKEMLKNTTDDREIAVIYDELFTMTKDADVLSKAISLYEKIYSRYPNVEYKNRILELRSHQTSEKTDPA
jgi:hypothetical protein